MKILLTIIMCSAVADTCLTPFTFDEPYNSTYECMIDGYTKALEKTIELGKEDVNEYDIYIKFMCEKDNKLLI
jgi:hypothetical protein|tara:strand:+ start:729 stop:947 length:219 start_codon:yes stop_codon:yes gene_type:complete